VRAVASLQAIIVFVALLSLKVSPHAEAICKMDGTQLEMNTCAKSRYEASDAALNTEWAKVTEMLARRDEKVLAQLRKAQKSWIGFRDSMCGIYDLPDQPRSMLPMQYFLCLERVTIDQTKNLNVIRCEYNECE
jgi:uncharacterized protein YecT (DUF1311 family)